MSAFDDLFNLKEEDFKKEEKEGAGTVEMYKPNAKDGEGNVYKALIRFLPWYKSPKESEKEKRVCWLENPETGEARYVDVQKIPGKKDIITDLFFKLKKSDSVRDQELANKFKSNQKFSSLVQVIKDKQHPELEGKILVFQYGYTIHNKIQEQIHPEYGKSCVPFDVFEGKPFKISVSLKAGFNNYDACEFMGETLPLTIDGETMKKTRECQEKILSWLEKNSPDLDKYACKEWNEETEKYVKSAIAALCPSEKVFSSVASSASTTTAKAAVKEEPEAKKEEKDDDIIFQDINTSDTSTDEELDDDDLYNLL